jgi:hypothetical protein
MPLASDPEACLQFWHAGTREAGAGASGLAQGGFAVQGAQQLPPMAGGTPLGRRSAIVAMFRFT